MNDKDLKSKNPALYNIARAAGTEPAFTGKYVNTKDDGMYHCSVCDAPLFSSTTKFESGSGWPSFTDAASESAVTLHEDTSLGLHRIEVRCAHCDSHLGHMFDDGPEQNGKTCSRFCINSISLDLKPD